LTTKADISTSPAAVGLGGHFLALGLLLCLVIAAGGLTYLKHAQAEARRVAQETLLAIADLKVGQIAGWMKDRRADAEVALYKVQARRSTPITDHRSQVSDTIRLTVEDHGCGIPEAIRQRIFDPFFTTKPHDKGTGLGLSISHGIVKDHGGRLSVESEPGRWTRFHVDLPIDDCEMRDAQ
jgi:nitrogen fixation/metabolism regulation signal transduction histidine kinase